VPQHVAEQQRRLLSLHAFILVLAVPDSPAFPRCCVRSEDGARPYTSLGFAEDPLNEASSQHHSEAGSADKQQRLRPSAHDREAALKYFIRFGTTTRLGEKLMPFYRFDRLLHAVGIVTLSDMLFCDFDCPKYTSMCTEGSICHCVKSARRLAKMSTACVT